ncbi:ABC transporter substrate-binding protein [Dactylosporangium sp. CA-233914]|uniref:ABC transporter substrate-binding protein n=1 Tax=Dactylosporangium sp. CA-233914 TaxID=3239934 RepID=UPI003D8F4BF8
MNRSITRKASLLGAAVLLASTLAACGGDEAARSSDDPFRVLTFLGLGAPFTELGQAYRAGEQAAADVINADGGVNGRQIEVTAADTACDATKSVAEFQERVVDSGKTPDVLIPGCSGETLALLPQTTQRKILTVNAIGNDEVNDVKKYPYEFNVYPRPTTSIHIIVEHLAKEGYKQIAHTGVNDASGQNFSKTIVEAGKAAGITVDSQLLDPTAVDASPTLLKLQSSDPDALVVSGSFGYAPIFKAISKLGWDLPIVADPNMAATNFVAAVAPDVLSRMQVLAFPAIVQGSDMTKTKAWKTFREAVDKQVGGKKITSPMQQYIQGYNSVLLAAGGYEGADSIDTEKVRRYLESGALPERYAQLIVGPGKLGLSESNHAFDYTGDDLIYTSVSAFNDGMLVP